MSVIIVGGGVGGLALAAKLSHERPEWDITILEKNDQVGGRLESWKIDGHRFDRGPSLFLMPRVFEKFYSEIGRSLEDELDLIACDPNYQVHFEDNSTVMLQRDLLKLEKEVEKMEPGSFPHVLSLIKEGHTHYSESFKVIAENFDHFGDYFRLDYLPLMWKLKALTKHYTNIKRYFKTRQLRAALTFQDMYLGLSPMDGPATYSLLQYAELGEGIYYPKGGMDTLAQSLARICKEQGVKIRLGCEVVGLEVDPSNAQHIQSVELRSGEVCKADKIVINADLPWAYSALVPTPPPIKGLGAKIMRSLTGLQDRRGWPAPAHNHKSLDLSSSCICFYWGLKERVDALKHHNVFLNSRMYQESFEHIFKGGVMPADPSFYIHAPSRMDSSAAPAGEDTLMVLVPVGSFPLDMDVANPTASQRDRMKKEVEVARKFVITRLQEIHNIDIPALLKFEDVRTPIEWASLYNLSGGCTFGLSHHYFHVGYLRPYNVHRYWRNLFFVGASTHPGSGLPMVILSAQLTAKRILEDRKIRKFPLGRVGQCLIVPLIILIIRILQYVMLGH